MDGDATLGRIAVVLELECVVVLVGVRNGVFRLWLQWRQAERGPLEVDEGLESRCRLVRLCKKEDDAQSVAAIVFLRLVSRETRGEAVLRSFPLRCQFRGRCSHTKARAYIPRWVGQPFPRERGRLRCQK